MRHEYGNSFVAIRPIRQHAADGKRTRAQQLQSRARRFTPASLAPLGAHRAVGCAISRTGSPSWSRRRMAARFFLSSEPLS
jgi:hypothetical protein